MKKFLFAAACVALVSLASCSNKDNSVDAANQNDSTAVADQPVVGEVEVESVTTPIDTLNTDSGKVVVEQTVTTVEGAAMAE